MLICIFRRYLSAVQLGNSFCKSQADACSAGLCGADKILMKKLLFNRIGNSLRLMLGTGMRM